MALQDLKKPASADKQKRKSLTAEEFIDQASLYATGLPIDKATNKDNVFDFITGKPIFAVIGKISEKKKETDKTAFKNATFSLSLKAIKQLNTLSRETGLAKSHILRVLINEFYELPKAEYRKLKKNNKKISQ